MFGVRSLTGVIFFAAFVLLAHSKLFDTIRYPFIFRTITIPVFQWILVLVYLAVWRYALREKQGAGLIRAVVIGVLMSLVFPLLATQKMVWQGTPLSRVYEVLIGFYVFMVFAILVVAGIEIIRKKNEFFYPVAYLSLYGMVFYCRHGHGLHALALAGLAAVIILLNLFNRRSVDTFVSQGMLFVRRRMSMTVILAGIFMVALCGQLLFLGNLLSIEGPNYPRASDDGDTYDIWGVRGVGDPGIYLRESPHVWMVFYAVFLTAIYKVFGHSYFAAGAAQSVLGALVCVMIALLAYKLTKSRFVALWAGIGVAINPAFIQLQTTLGTEALYMPLLVLAILMLKYYQEARSNGLAIFFICAAGLVFGLTSIIREVACGLVPLVMCWILIGGRTACRSIWSRGRDAALVCVFVLLPIAPITYINYHNTGKFVLIYQTERSLWQYVSPYGEDVVPSNTPLVRLGMKDPMTDPAGAVALAVRKPGEVIRSYASIIPKRIRNIFFWPSFGYFDPLYLINNSRLANPFASCLEFYVLICFAAGAVFFLRANIPASGKILVLLVVIYYVILHGIVYISQSPRYSSPLIPFMDIVVAAGLYGMFKKLAKGAS
ncbi:MAG: hypothetical protein PHS37_04040 [Candidatus Omnitrophica bacterium]|nr:hypothetical protein [Candidatus Omnitrophota bacterium]